MRNILRSTLVILSIVATARVAAGDDIEARIYKNKKGQTMPYRVMKPLKYDSKKQYPLVICLHGAGARGTDNRSRGSEAFKALSSPGTRSKYACFAITPQCPAGKKWVDTPWKKGSYSTARIRISDELTLVLEIIASVRDEFSIDPARIYVTGQSMGGFGTWDIIVREPGLFAAAIPVCGGGDPDKANTIKHIAIWNFHGDQDTTVPTDASREMCKALEKAGGNIKYTEYKGVGHGSYHNAWKEPDLLPWLFEQKK